MLKRNIEEQLKKALLRSPVVLLNGARQVGKTTLALELLKEKNYTYITFDDEIVFLAAKSNPTAFIADITKPVIIDEVQRVPELFLAIKRDVDANRHAGRYLLTGSANPLLIPRLGDSLAGRMEIINLMPLSQGEILQHKEQFIDLIFSEQPLKSPANKLTKKELYEKMLVGGYPSVQQVDQETRDAWLRSYLNLLLQKDIKDLAQIEKLTELPNLLKLLAARASGLLNVAELSRDSKLVAKTLHRYLALLETIFIINTQPAWSTNLSVRFVKAPKLYFIDSGLLMYLLDMNIEKAAAENVHMGRVLENFVVSELQKQATWSTQSVNFYHFRTSSGEEVDTVIENRSGNIVGIEIKASSKVTPQDFKGLTFLQEKAKEKFVRGIVLYTGTEYVPFGERLCALPINSLWQ